MYDFLCKCTCIKHASAKCRQHSGILLNRFQTTNGIYQFQVIINYRDLFQAPTFDELEQVAGDGFGDLKKLSADQLQSVWDSGYSRTSNNLL